MLLGSLALMALAPLARAHIALWDAGMFGLNYPYQSDDANNNNYNNEYPVTPLRESDGLTTSQWLGHGLLGYPPKSGDFMVLPAGGTYNGEVSCNRAQTTLGDPSNTDPLPLYACAAGTGPLHVMNVYNEAADPQWFGGTALAIAYTSDESSVQPNDFTVISINHNSVWERSINYEIPAGLPACPAGGCLCSWNWIHEANHGEGYPFEIYNIIYRCTVTGATSKGIVQRGAVPVDCTGDSSKCVAGPKTPMYTYQADGNNIPHLAVPPRYNVEWGWRDGAQNDIFNATRTPASNNYISNPWAATKTNGSL